MNTLKKYLLLSIFSSVLLIIHSCEKPVLTDDITNSGETIDGNLTVSVYQLEQTPFFALTRTAASEACTRLSFAIYNEAGARIKQTDQTSDMANFGHASFLLPEGTYQVVVLAHSSNGNPTMTNPAKIPFTNAKGYTDTFLYSEEIAVTDEKQELKVSLDRIVALCRFVVTDDIPAEVKKMQFKYTGGSGAFNAYTGFGCVKSTQTVTYSVSADKKQFDLYTFLHDTEGTIHLTVTALDDASNVVNQKEFDVPMAQNQISWFSGPFFDSNTNQNGIDIDINTTWDGEIHLTF